MILTQNRGDRSSTCFGKSILCQSSPMLKCSSTRHCPGGQLTGAASPGGITAAGLQQWLLCFSVTSQHLRCVVALLTCWIANNFSPWAVTQALLTNRLMALEKCLSIRPIGIGEIWRRLLAKCVLKVASAEAKDTCGNAQLCTGLESGIEGAVHTA